MFGEGLRRLRLPKCKCVFRLNFLKVTASVVRRGPIEVVDFAMASWLTQMTEDLQATPTLSDMKVRERIHLGIKTRLECVLPYQEVWP